MVRFLVLIAAIAFLSLSFNNCGRVLPGQGVESGVFSSQASFGKAMCEAQLKSVYSQGYHGLFSSACNSCHSTAHGSTDANVSFASFRTKAFATYKSQARTAHGGFAGDKGPEFDSLEATWKTAENAYVECMASTGGPDLGASDILLSNKPLPANIVTRSRANANNFETMTWDAAAEVARNSDLNKFKATFSIQVRIDFTTNGTGGVARGLTLRNPTLTLRTGQAGPVIMDKLGLHADNVDISQFTAFSGSLIQPALPGGSTNIVPTFSGFAPVPNPQPSITTVAFKFVGIRLSGGGSISDPGGGGGGPAGPPVTFAELSGTDVTKNVFARTCASCHSPQGPNGNILNITSYAEALNDATIILNRINSGSMPPGQPLSPADRDLVQRWFDAGRPQ